MSAILGTSLATNALVSALIGGIGDGRPIYDHHVPASPSYPFGLLMALTPDMEPSGSHGDPEGNVELAYQLDAVGRSRLAAQAMADKIRGILMNRLPSGEFMIPVTMSGWVNVDRRTLHGPGGIQREGDRKLELYVQRTDYALMWVPA